MNCSIKNYSDFDESNYDDDFIELYKTHNTFLSDIWNNIKSLFKEKIVKKEIIQFIIDVKNTEDDWDLYFLTNVKLGSAIFELFTTLIFGLKTLNR